MKPTGFYKLTSDYFEVIKKVGGVYRDSKERPTYCCIQDQKNPDVYWAIPTSNISHRPQEQLDRIKRLCALPDRDIRSCYYHLGHTNRPAIFRVSSVLPVADRYIEGEYTSQGAHLVLRDKKLIADIERKLSRILFDESRHPDKYEQRITSIYTFIANEVINTAELNGDNATQDEAVPADETLASTVTGGAETNQGDKPSVIEQIRASRATQNDTSSQDPRKPKSKNDPDL